MQISRCLIRARAQAAQLKFERVAVANCKFRGASYKPGPRSHNSILNVWLTRTANFEVRQTGLGPSRTTHTPHFAFVTPFLPSIPAPIRAPTRGLTLPINPSTPILPPSRPQPHTSTTHTPYPRPHLPTPAPHLPTTAQAKLELIAHAKCKFRGALYGPGPKPHSSTLKERLMRDAIFEVRLMGLRPGPTARF